LLAEYYGLDSEALISAAEPQEMEGQPDAERQEKECLPKKWPRRALFNVEYALGLTADRLYPWPPTSEEWVCGRPLSFPHLIYLLRGNIRHLSLILRLCSSKDPLEFWNNFLSLCTIVEDKDGNSDEDGEKQGDGENNQLMLIEDEQSATAILETKHGKQDRTEEGTKSNEEDIILSLMETAQSEVIGEKKMQLKPHAQEIRKLISVLEEAKGEGDLRKALQVSYDIVKLSLIPSLTLKLEVCNSLVKGAHGIAVFLSHSNYLR